MDPGSTSCRSEQLWSRRMHPCRGAAGWSLCSQGKEGEAVVTCPLLCLIFHEPLLEQPHLVWSGCASTAGQDSIRLLFPIKKTPHYSYRNWEAQILAEDGLEHHFNAVTTLKLHPIPIEVGGKAPIDLSGSRIRPPYINMVGKDPSRPYSWLGVWGCQWCFHWGNAGGAVAWGRTWIASNQCPMALCAFIRWNFRLKTKGLKGWKTTKECALGSSANQMFVSFSLFLTMTKKLVNSLKPSTRSAWN